MTRNLGQVFEERVFVFFIIGTHGLFVRGRKVRNLGVDPFQGPIISIVFANYTHILVFKVHQPCPHPPSSPIRGHAAADNHQTVMPGIHG